MAERPSTRRRWPPRFSLRTLLLAVLLIGSGATLWWHWEPWELWYNFPSPGGRSAVFSPDSSHVAIEGTRAIIVDLKSGAIIAEMPGETGADKCSVRWSTNGHWLFIVNGWGKERYGSIWDASHWTTNPVADADWIKHAFAARPGIANAAYGKSIALPSTDDKDWLTTFAAQDGRIVSVALESCGMVRDDSGAAAGVYENARSSVTLAKLLIPRPISQNAYFTGRISPDGNWAGVCGGSRSIIWSRRRPEYWWGVAWLPEFWLTVVLAGAFVWSLWKDRRETRTVTA